MPAWPVGVLIRFLGRVGVCVRTWVYDLCVCVRERSLYKISNTTHPYADSEACVIRTFKTTND